ncbi:MAG: nucleotidyltransferase [Crocinitomicaceae bacterium]|jgi:hypothetical protein|nr:nucleotidyltransferase [Crocinitomicaceae bacterium]
MKTLLQSINEFIDNITVTDRQEEMIENSVNNLDQHLTNEDNDLGVSETFSSGSWERDTILRPLDDVDIFCVLDREHWQDDYKQLPNPQSVLSKMKKYLEDIHDYKDKVSQSRPCVTISLSKIDFDVLPSFDNPGGGYFMPNHDLTSWTMTDPEKLEDNLAAANKNSNNKLKGVIRAIKSWNRDNEKLIPSFHIEEVAINIQNLFSFTNNEQAIRKWFEYAELYLLQNKFDTKKKYDTAIENIKLIKNRLSEAESLSNEKKESEAIEIWKEIFGKEFPAPDIKEAKSFSESLSNGSLKISSTGLLSENEGMNIKKSDGYYGDVSKE